MLQKKRSNNTMQLKFALIIPVLIAFVFTFNTKVIAQKNDEWKVEIKTDRVDFYENITKNFTKTDLEKLKTRLASQNIIFKFKNLKFNSNNEITGISISVRDKNGNKSNLSQKGDKPIKTIYIHINSNGILSLGNTANTPQPGAIFINSGTNGNQQNYAIKSSNKGDKKNSFVFITGEDDKNEPIFVQSSSNNIKFSSPKGKKTWVTKSGDSIVVKENILFIQSDDKINASNNKNIIYRSTSNKSPLIIIDGKEMKNGNLDDIASDMIKSMNVLKGETAINKYGEKGKDGVVEISTKNEKIMVMSSDGKKPLIIINGKEIKEGKVDDIDPNTIKSVKVLKGETAINKYGEKGKDGVVEISTKK